MSSIDVSAEILIAAEPTDVAGVMFDPHREPEWIAAATTVEVIDAAIRPGARVRHTSHVLGQDVTWTTEVTAFRFPHQLVLTTADGPFAGTVQYEVGRSGAGSIARVRNVGEMRGLPAALVIGRLRSTLEESLARLKALVERRA